MPSGPAESDAAYERRLKLGSYVEEGMKRSRRKKRAILLALAVVTLCIALAVGVFAFFKTTDTNLSLADSTAADALVAQPKDKPYYVLCSADLRDHSYAKSRPEDIAYMLVRVDEGARTLSVVSLPAVLDIPFPDDEHRTLSQAHDEFSDGDIIAAVGGFVGVDISHYITTDTNAIAAMADLVGGVKMNIAQEIDDPAAGHIVLRAGDVVLDGPSAEVFLRATNLQGGFEVTAANRAAFTLQLLAQALDTEGLNFASIVSDASRYIDTDYSTSDLLSIGEFLRPLDSVTVYECSVPFTATKSVRDDTMVYSCNKSEWEGMAEAYRNGSDPSAALGDSEAVETSQVTVEVRNGTSINGAAASLAQMLSQLGYDVIGTGNTGDGTTYPETLVVYTDPAYADAAKSIIREVGIGRVVNGGDFYTSDAGIIAIIGADWAR